MEKLYTPADKAESKKHARECVDVFPSIHGRIREPLRGESLVRL